MQEGVIGTFGVMSRTDEAAEAAAVPVQLPGMPGTLPAPMSAGGVESPESRWEKLKRFSESDRVIVFGIFAILVAFIFTAKDRQIIYANAIRVINGTVVNLREPVVREIPLVEPTYIVYAFIGVLGFWNG